MQRRSVIDLNVSADFTGVTHQNVFRGQFCGIEHCSIGDPPRRNPPGRALTPTVSRLSVAQRSAHVVAVVSTATVELKVGRGANAGPRVGHKLTLCSSCSHIVRQATSRVSLLYW